MHNWVYFTDVPNVFEGFWDKTFGKLSIDNGEYPYKKNAYLDNDYGAWSYLTQGTSRIFDVEINASGSSSGALTFVSIVAPSGETWVEQGKTWVPWEYPYGSADHRVCADQNCSSSGGSGNNATVFQLAAIENGDAYVHSSLNSASVKIAQDQGAAITFDTTSAQIEGKPNALYGGGKWFKASEQPKIKASAVDPGIGIEKFTVAGVATSLKANCVGVQCDSSASVTRSVGGLAEGASEVSATAQNAAISSTVKTTVKIDNSGPSVSLSGLGANYITGLGEAELTVQVTDGKSKASSGVAAGKTSVALDGEEILAPGGAGCSPGPCAIERSYGFVGREVGVGEHQLVVEAVDQIGNVTTREFQFVVKGPDGPSVDLGPGKLNLQSGEFILSSSDVAEATPVSVLSMSRTHESLAPPALESPLGPHWQLTFGAWRRARLMPDGTFVITDAKGRQVVFQKVSGKYKAPSGYDSWSLTPGQWDELILRSSDGGKTTFGPVGQAPDSLYAPRSIAGPDGLSTYIVWAYYGGVLRPSAVYAPDAGAWAYCGPDGMPCRYLTFHYDSNTTATGGAPSEWGNYQGRLSSVKLVAWDHGAQKGMNVAVAEYSYDAQGRLRAVWDPRISPALKTTYGYDAAGRVSAVSPPGQQAWAMTYGRPPGEDQDDWLLSVSRAGASAELGDGDEPENVEPPRLSSRYPVTGTAHRAWNGDWENVPTSYSYQWSVCDDEGQSCTAISGAANQRYAPSEGDVGKRLKVTVTAVNAGGSVSAESPLSKPVVAAEKATYHTSLGSSGADPGEFKFAGDIGQTSDGDFWVADVNNHRIQKLDAEGDQLDVIAEGGEGKWLVPNGLAVDAEDNVWITDSGRHVVEQFDPDGDFVQRFGGGWGTEPGEFRHPQGIAIDPDGDVLVTDMLNGRLQEFTPGGELIRVLGSQGSGPGQFEGPGDVTVAADGTIWVADFVGDDIEVLEEDGDFVRSFGSLGAAEGQFNQPVAITLDAKARVWVADQLNDRVQQFDQEGEFVRSFGESGSGEGQFDFGWPVGMVADSEGGLWITDGYNDRVQGWLFSRPAHEIPPPPDPETAVWTAIYDVPISGTGAPEAMDAETISSWGQSEAPASATAVFPPDEIPSRQPSGYDRATVYYLNESGQIVNTRAPGGRISTEEHDALGNVTRSLTPENRARALEASWESQALSGQLDTQFAYSEDGSLLHSVLGPKREVELESGEVVQARPKTRYFYDEGAPDEGGPYNLVTKQTEAALVGGEEHDVRTETFGYGGQSGLGWELGKPTSETTDPGGLDLIRVTLYDPDSGDVVETRMPASPEGGDAGATRTIYYTAQENEEAEECGGRPDWSGLVCQTRPAAQPETPEVPDLPVTTTTYNTYLQPLVTSEVVGEASRTATIEYDDAGRPVNAAISSSSGVPLPDVQTLYDEETGLPTVQATETEAIVSEYDSLGRLISYTDADENTSTFAYDVLGRVAQSFDGKGTQTFSYDATTGDLDKVEDSAVGTFTAEHDAGGKVVEMGYPNDLEARYDYDAGGTATGLRYVDTSECSEECVWFEDEVTPSIHGETSSQETTLADTTYSYDDAGRLLRAEETPQGEGCTTRIYAYDANTNRTSSTTRGPAEGGGCAEAGGQTQTTAFDEADRLLGEGVAYDDFGNVTDLPGAYAGGEALSSTYYADDSAASLSQDGVTIEYMLDPVGREREAVTTDGEAESELISHFSGDGDSPSWTEDGSGNWTRYVGGMSGLTAIQSSTEGIDLQVSDLSGNLVATMPGVEAEGLSFLGEATEYGEPQVATPATYSWLGSAQRPVELDSGVVNMGARTYVPDVGRFLQVDPIAGGSANAYAYVHGDPVSEADPSGEYTPGRVPGWLTEYMENPPGMPPPPPPPPLEVELFEEEFWGGGGEMEFFFGLGDVVGAVTGFIGPLLSGLGKAAKFIGKGAGWVASKVGGAAAKAYRAAARFAIEAAKGAARTAKSVAEWVRREFTTNIPQLVGCVEEAFNTILRHNGDWKARAAAGALACRDGWRDA